MLGMQRLIASPYFAGRTPFLGFLRSPPISPNHVRALYASTNPSNPSFEVLERFWLARGVADAIERQRLVDVGILHNNDPESLNSFSNSDIEDGTPLPGVSSTWSSSIDQVVNISKRLLALQQLISGGRDDIDLAWMVEKEPGLLTVDFSALSRRLVELRTAEAGNGLDIAKVVEQQPSLLLQQGTVGGNSESLEQRRLAWSYGLLADGDSDWDTRWNELCEYVQAFGDSHAGFREGDDGGLARWAEKQRKEYTDGSLTDRRLKKLRTIGFEFDSEQAEWMRWFFELQTEQAQLEAGEGVPFTHSGLSNSRDFYLVNWCAIQRIMRRKGMLKKDREVLLESIGFDFNAPDPLS